MTEPLVSYVLPTKNRVEWLGEALLSLVTQSEPDIEIIVINDGSTDDTKELLESAWVQADHRIRVIHHEESQGAGPSRNEGTVLAKANIVAQFDDDDMSVDNRTYETLKWFKEHPESEMVSFPYVRVSMLNEIQENFPGEPFDYEEYAKNGHIRYFCNPSCAYKRESFLDTKGYQRESKDETDDYGMVRNWIKAGKKIDFCPGEAVLLHRVLPNSMMTQFRGYDGK